MLARQRLVTEEAASSAGCARDEKAHNFSLMEILVYRGFMAACSTDNLLECVILYHGNHLSIISFYCQGPFFLAQARRRPCIR
jgi:hypothetical protein